MNYRSNQKLTILTKEEATKLRKPKYNGFACGYGAHGSKKYDRNKIKRIPFE